MLSPQEIKKLETKISAVEDMTSAEFKIIICPHDWTGLKRKAQKLFRKYKLNNTDERNSVLILVVEKDRELLIYGDEGIHQKVGEGFWLNVKEDMLALFKTGEFAEGLSLGLHLIADQLADYFPKKKSKNELSNGIIYEK